MFKKLASTSITLGRLFIGRLPSTLLSLSLSLSFGARVLLILPTWFQPNGVSLLFCRLPSHLGLDCRFCGRLGITKE
ncbi:hypothetical protein K1719_028628 [Acacia pycnantha]|nr:hypothetical protein K1719_028628 [Acacia pycnantha]